MMNDQFNAPPAVGGQSNTTRNIIIAVVVVSVIACCCCFAILIPTLWACGDALLGAASGCSF